VFERKSVAFRHSNSGFLSGSRELTVTPRTDATLAAQALPAVPGERGRAVKRAVDSTDIDFGK
jgi:hypothetical protein